MRLIGAMEFLKTVREGTLCIGFWLRGEDDCRKLANDYESGMSVNDITKRYYPEIFIFGDNSASLAFTPRFDYLDDEDTEIIDGHKYDCLNYYDLNIVGDASPWTTLYLVFDDETEWPERIVLQDYNSDCTNEPIPKEGIKAIVKWFLEECGPFRKEFNASALESLNEPGYSNWVTDYKGKRR